MRLRNIVITPYAFSDNVIISTKSIIIDNVQIIHHGIDQYTPYDLSLLESSIFMDIQLVLTDIDQVLITNVNLNGGRSYFFRIDISSGSENDKQILKKMQIKNCILRNNLRFIGNEAGRIKQLYIENSTFTHAHATMFKIQTTDMLIINESRFESYGRASMLTLINIQEIIIENNSFDFATLETLSSAETQYFIEDSGVMSESTFSAYVIEMSKLKTVSLVNNIFGYNKESAEIIVHPALYIEDTNVCISNNTFHNFAMYSYHSNVTSCFRPYMYEFCEIGSCCDKYGPWAMQLMDKMNFFIIKDKNIRPIAQFGPSLAYLDNIVFDVADNVTEIIVPDGNFLFTDVLIQTTNNQYINFKYDDVCNVLCSQILTNVFIAQLQISCGYKHPYTEYDTLLLSDWTGLQHVPYGNAHSIVLSTIGQNNSYYPGQFIKFNHSIVDKMGNNVLQYNYSIEILINIIDVIDDTIFETTKIIIDATGHCLFCETGVYFPSITFDEIGKTFLLETQDSENIFSVSNLNIFIVECPSGFGADVFNSHCSECVEDSYQLLSDSIQSCISCKSNQKNNGFKCHGGDDIMVLQNHWISVQQLSNGTITTGIVSAFCPNYQCCLLADGCNYLLDTNNLCAENRDPKVPLCGACNPGFSESMNSASCCKCDERGVYIEWLFYPLIVSLGTTIYILLSKSQKTHKNEKNINNMEIVNIKTETEQTLMKRVIKNERLLEMVKFMFSKVFIYFEQQLYHILLSGSIVINMSTFSAFFDLSSTQNTGGNASDCWCFVDGLTAKDKILCNLIGVSMTVGLVIVSSFILNKYFNHKRTISILKALYALLLLVISQMLSIIFKFLSCAPVGEKSYHFYFSSEECHGIYFYFALFSLICIILIFCALFFKLSRMDVMYRQTEDNPLNVFVKSYNISHWWWEFVILTRRIILIFIVTVFKTNISLLILIFILGIFLILQNKYKPFIMDEVNEAEEILLLVLIFALSTHTTLATNVQSDEYTLAYILFTFFIIIPFILLVYYVWLSIKKIKNETLQNDSLQKLEIFKQRIKYFFLSIIVWYSMSNSSKNDVVADKNSEKQQLTPMQRIRSLSPSITTENETKMLEMTAVNNDNELSNDVNNINNRTELNDELLDKENVTTL
eukprot:726_1